MVTKNEIEAALERLTRGYGLYRKDLIEALQGDLNVLQRYWGLDLSKGPDAVRRSITAILDAHLEEIEPSSAHPSLAPDQRKKQYSFNTIVNFNAIEDRRLTHVTKKPLMQRREWLAEQPKPYGIKTRTGQRNLDHAIRQIAKRIIEAGLSASPESEADQSTLAADHAEESTADYSSSGASNSEQANDPKRPWSRPRWIAVTVISAIAVLAGAYEIASYASSATSAPRPSVSGSASSQFPASNSPPIALTAELTATFLDGDGVWVFPSSIGANPLQVITGIAPQITTRAPGIGGKLVSPGIFRITIDNTSPYTVTINAMRPVITNRTAPAMGILVSLGGQSIQARGQLGFNLDMTAPYAQQVGSDGKLAGTSFFKEHFIKLTPGDQDEIDLTAITTQADYTFKLELDVSVDGHLRTLDFDGPNGKPFEVTGKAARYVSHITNGLSPNPTEILYTTP